MNNNIRGNTNEFLKHIYNIRNMFFLNIKVIFSIPILFFCIFVLPLILLFGLAILITETSLLSPAIGLMGILITGITFGYIYFSLENSTFKYNINSLNINKFDKISSIFLSTFVVIILSTLIQMAFFIIFESNNIIFMHQFIFESSDSRNSIDIRWKYVPWDQFIYYIFMSTSITFFLCVFVAKFIKKMTPFFIFVCIYFLYVLFFGGQVSQSFLWNTTISDDSGLASSEWLLRREEPFKIETFFDVCEYVCPHFWLNQNCGLLLRVGSISAGQYDWNYGLILPEFDSFNPSLNPTTNYFQFTDEISWNLTIIMPPIYLISLFGSSLLILK